MAGDALCVQSEPGLALVGDLDGAIRRLGIEHIVVGSNDAVGNELIRADHDVLLVHRGDEQKVMLQLFAHGSNAAKRQHTGCEAGLHVARAAAVHPAVDDLGCQRVMVPAVAERDGVLMADVDQTRAALLTLECGDDVAAAVLHLVAQDIRAGLHQKIVHKIRHLVFKRAGVRALDPDELLRERHFFDRAVIHGRCSFRVRS